MKNLAKLVALSFGFYVASLNANAVLIGGSGSGGVVGPAGGAPAPDVTCALMTQQVTLAMSKNNLGAMKCDEATTTLGVGTCSTGGSRKSTSVTCSVLSTDPATGAITYNDPNCNAGNLGKTVTYTDYSGFGGTNQGTGISQSALKGACTTSTVNALPSVQ
jgi:hypothetical protein